VLHRPAQGGGHEGPRHSSAARLVAAEHLGQEGPQRQGGGPETVGWLAEGDVFLGEGLGNIVGGQHVGEGQALGVEKGGEGVVEGRRSRKRHGGLPCSNKESSVKEGLPPGYRSKGRPP